MTCAGIIPDNKNCVWQHLILLGFAILTNALAFLF